MKLMILNFCLILIEIKGLETCPQANLVQSVHSATTLLILLITKNNSIIRRTSMTQRLVENTLHTLAHFRLYRLNVKPNIFTIDNINYYYII